MAANHGEQALSGEWEEITAALKFEITEIMTMEFKGESCNIADTEGKLVENLGTAHGHVSRELLPGYKCYVVKAWVRFTKRPS